VFSDFAWQSLTHGKSETFQATTTLSFVIDPVLKMEFDTGFTPASFWM
jgi:hypothetical protein